MSTTDESRPVIGITCYQAPAQWGFWNLPAALVPLGYVERVTASVGDGLCATAWADDGSVEALEDPAKRFAVGVLWHPEEGADGRLFAELVAIAGTQSGLHA
ncbi:MAG: gamma-glutamyl-gamma-aminobutyrate hydrolase family protein [Solirubrobacteraceae bacterium]